jgi:hypothetical protein
MDGNSMCDCGLLPEGKTIHEVQVIEWHRPSDCTPENDLEILCKTRNFRHMTFKRGDMLEPWRIAKYGITHWAYIPGVHPDFY